MLCVELSICKVEIYYVDCFIVESIKSVCVLEIVGVFVYMIFLDDIVLGVFLKMDEWFICEWKGVVYYFDVVVGGKVEEKVVWVYFDFIDDLG